MTMKIKEIQNGKNIATYRADNVNKGFDWIDINETFVLKRNISKTSFDVTFYLFELPLLHYSYSVEEIRNNAEYYRKAMDDIDDLLQEIKSFTR